MQRKDQKNYLVKPDDELAEIFENGAVRRAVIDRKIGDCIGIKRMKALGRKGIPEKLPSHVYITATHFIELSRFLNDMVKAETSHPGTTKKWIKFLQCHWEYDFYQRSPIHHDVYSSKCCRCRSYVNNLAERAVWWFPIGKQKCIKMSFKNYCNDDTFQCSILSIRTYGVLEAELTVENVADSQHLRRSF